MLSGRVLAIVILLAGLPLFSALTKPALPFARPERDRSAVIERPAAPPQLLCLMYHRFASAAEFATLSRDEQLYTVTTESFDRHLRILSEAGYESLSLADGLSHANGRRPIMRPAVLITIDDGCQSAVRLAAPLLRRHGMTATLFVTTDERAYVFGCDTNRPDPRMTSAELAAWIDQGFDVGSHGVTHRPLNTLSNHDLAYELVTSRKALQAMIQRPIPALAIPRGRYDARVLAAAREAGYRCVFTSDRGFIRPGDNVFALPRWNISGRWSDQKFLSLLNDASGNSRSASVVTGNPRPKPVE